MLFRSIGVAQFYKGDLDKAVNYFETAVKKNPKYAKAYYMLAETYTKKARFLDAELNAKKAIQFSPLKSSRAHLDVLTTVPFKEITAISAVPPPISTIIFPHGLEISIPAPIAAATGSSIIETSLAPA